MIEESRLHVKEWESLDMLLRLSKNGVLQRLMENVQMQGFRNPEE